MERKVQSQDFTEYCAALAASATYNVNRKAGTPFIKPRDLMRRRANGPVEPSAPMRYALPGERPPSRRPPGTNDNVIDRLDIFAARLKQVGGRIN